MSDAERWNVYNALLERSVNGKLKRITTKDVSDLLSIPMQTVQKIWRQAKNTPNGEDVDVSHRRKGKCGPKKKEIDLSRVMDVPLHRRTTIRSVAAALDVSKSTMHRRIKEDNLKRHSNAIKPRLKEDNKKARLQFCLSMVDRCSLPNLPKFVDMYNVVHIDEKWFYMTKKKENYYLHPVEEEPLRTCQSKNYITKVMFLAAMARTRFDEEGNEIFSGKIGIFRLLLLKQLSDEA